MSKQKTITKGEVLLGVLIISCLLLRACDSPAAQHKAPEAKHISIGLRVEQ